ncbi:hypothetical protein NDU88_002186 [Pleurodeles waltl]|uniref:Uncharacterized protein n=1 Tax=Pleurodeles waltl TaxID=8319 RepID=A0AAV7ND05_PLEWA|nr:hypothetical protein NDU88_002186 [Pleurodeles waltl]
MPANPQTEVQECSSSNSKSEDSQKDSPKPKKTRKSHHVSSEALTHSCRNLLLTPEDIIHPRSMEWVPSAEVAHYVQDRLCKSFEKEVRNTLFSECHQPSLLSKVADPLELDPSMATFLKMFAKDPKNGLDSAWRGCQDKLLDLSGPLTNILDLAFQSRETNTPLDTEVVSEWAQRAICLLDNVECAMSTEHRDSFLMPLNPKLADLVPIEAGTLANAILFGDRFVKVLGKYVATFTALE